MYKNINQDFTCTHTKIMDPRIWVKCLWVIRATTFYTNPILTSTIQWYGYVFSYKIYFYRTQYRLISGFWNLIPDDLTKVIQLAEWYFDVRKKKFIHCTIWYLSTVFVCFFLSFRFSTVRTIEPLKSILITKSQCFVKSQRKKKEKNIFVIRCRL